jgi:hypothetical protein
MPAGMLLISSWGASHIAHPERALTLDAYQAAHQARLAVPVPVEDFIRYGLWFQRRVAPDVDRRMVARVEPAADGFRLALEDGESLHARRVVVATGLAPFVHRPRTFDGLPPSLASHTAEHNDLGVFAGRRVAVIGAGQSAFTSAALLRESGAEVEVIVRESEIHWVQRTLYRHTALAPLRRLLYAPTDVGPAGLSRIVGLPGLFSRLPREWRERIARRAIQPAAAPWLRPRVRGVPIATSRRVVSATPAGERLRLALDDGSAREVDHALLATGYRIDVARYPFLAPELARAVRCVDGYPDLTPGFESSAPGLHFAGATAAATFGPVMRFVSGTPYTARAIARRVTGAPPARARVLREGPALAGLEGD